MVEDSGGLGREVPSERGEHDAAAAPLEQRLAELVLERPDLPAQGGCEMWSRSAARVTCCSSATATKYRNCWRLIAVIVPEAATGIESQEVLDGADPGPHGARMAITILSHIERDRMRRAGRAAASTLAYVGARLAPGMTTAEIDRMVRLHTEAQGGRPSQLGYHNFPAAVCISRNDIVCHGVPSAHIRLAEGDIVNVDITTELDGYHGDTSATFVIGHVAQHAATLVELARGARDAGIAAAVSGGRLGDIGAAIVRYVGDSGSIVEAYGGHGIGRAMHMDPHVSHVGRRHSDHRLREGMAFTVEPMINGGTSAIRTDADGWTVRTADGALSAQFEHTVLIGPHGPEITTVLD
jgi:methionyl aminopeptidase